MATAVAPLGGGGPYGGPGPDADQLPLILITTVDIGDGNSDLIEVRQGDDPFDLAAAFVAKHNLPPAITEALSQHLRDNLQQAGAGASAGGRGGYEEGYEADKAGALCSTRGTGGALSARSESGRYGGGETDTVVFERLYHQAMILRQKIQEKKMRYALEQEATLSSKRYHRSWISREMMRERGSGPYENYGEMLYAESLEGAARRRMKEQRQRAVKVAEELSAATFQPEITRMAKELRLRGKEGSAPAWQRLSKGAFAAKSKTAERMEALRKSKEEAETRECTFRPALCRKSDRLMMERTDTFRALHVSPHQQLYQDSLRRQQKQEAYSHWFPEDVTFQPKLIAAQRRPGGAVVEEAPLVERLYSSYEKLQAKLAEARAKLEGVDPATGRPLHVPQTGRAPSFSRHGPERGVGDYLHGLQGERDEKARQRAEEDERRADEARVIRAAGASAAIVFDFLDKASAGWVDLAAIVDAPPACLEDLDDDVRDDLEVAARLAVKGSAAPATAGARGGAEASPRTAVPREVFYSLMEEAISLRPFPRAYLTPSPPPKYVPHDAFAPAISERSKQLAARMRPKDAATHELLYREAAAIATKKAAARAAADEAEMAQCTFAPRLLPSPVAVEARFNKELSRKPSGRSPGAAAALEDAAAAPASEAPAPTRRAEPAVRAPAPAPATPAAAAASEAGRGRAAAVAVAAAAAAAPHFSGGLSELRAALDSAARANAEACADSDSDGAAADGADDAEADSGDDEVPASEDASSDGARSEAGGDDGVSASEGDEGDNSEVEELEREVEAMLEATNAALATAGHLNGRTDQKYLSKILGLTQEAIDSMEPAMSRLPGWDPRSSRGGALPAVPDADEPASAAAAAAPAHAPAASGSLVVTRETVSSTQVSATATRLAPLNAPLLAGPAPAAAPAGGGRSGLSSAAASPAATSLFSVPFGAAAGAAGAAAPLRAGRGAARAAQEEEDVDAGNETDFDTEDGEDECYTAREQYE
ncbi:MAG: hypothetical protein J3K34DRAFT_478827 [Monoraphidium minutum]|nr:MAG: hypothetical protein J3K34DRAFT_478827 [Monoraphidium minutum]